MKKALLAVSAVFLSFFANAIDYYWVGGTAPASGFQDRSNWSTVGVGGAPVGTSGTDLTFTTSDKLIIDGSDVSSVAGIQTGSIVSPNGSSSSVSVGQLILQNNANFSISGSATRSLTVGGGLSGDDLVINSGCYFNVREGSSAFTLVLAANNTGLISGTIEIGNSGTNNASTFTINTSGSLTVATNGTWVHAGTGGISTPLDRAVFQTNSNMVFKGSSACNTSISISGRTFSNLYFESSSGNWNPNLSGAGTLTINGNLFIGGSGAGNFSTGTGFSGNVVVNGNVTIKSGSTLAFAGNYDVKGNWTNNGGTFTNAATKSTTFSGTTLQTVSKTGGESFRALIISNTSGSPVLLANGASVTDLTTINSGAILATASTLTTSGGATVNGTFQINQGGYATGGTWTYGANAKLIFNHTSGTYGPIVAGHSYWPSADGPRRVEVANKVSGGINMGVARTVADSFITAQQVAGTALTLNGVCQLNDGGYFSTAPIYGSAATLVYNTGATTYGRFNELTTGSGIPANITINAGSGLDYGNGATGTARTLTGNLIINGQFLMNNGANDMTQALTVNGNVSIGTAGTLSLSDAAGGDIKVGGNWTITGSGAFNPKSRAVFFLNAGTSTITTASPASFDFLIVDKSSGGTVNLANNATVNQTLTLTNGDLVIGANTLTLNAGVARTSGNFRGGITSNLTVNGTAGSLFFASGGTNNYLRNLTLGTGGTATLGNALNITDYDGSAEGVLTVNSTSGGLTTGGFLTLKSSANGTARVAAGRTSGGYIIGDVTVERFIPQNSRKGWRLLASTTSGQTINAAWQEGAVGDGVNPNPGFGTIITGRTSTFGTLSAANAAGYDALSSGHGLLKYNPTTDNLDPVANTNSTNINSEHGYFVFIRGDRQAGSIDVGLPTAPTTSTVLRSKGSLFLGDQSAVSTGALDWGLVRNPYPSRIDMRNIVRGGALVDAFQVWDPKVNTVGVYQTFTKNLGTGNYEVTPGGGSYGSIGSVQNFIESGLAFFIQSSGGTGTAQVTEACKTSGSSVAFRPATPQNLGERFYFSLYALNSSSTDMVDGGYVDFDNLYTASVDGYDVRKSPNFGENFGLIRDNVSLVVERRAPINRNDTLFFDMNTLKNISYRIDLSAVNIDPIITTAFLEDRFTGTSTPVDLTGGITSYTFQASNTAGSKAADRFRLVFRQSTVVPVSIVSVKAIQQNRDIRVEWKVASQVNVSRYEVERSADGRIFTKVAEQTASNTELYNWLDASVTNGTFFYRIRAVDQNGTFRYSSIVKVVVGSGKAGISVSPNPVRGNFINLQFSHLEAGKYGIRLINMAGQTVYKREMQHAGGSASESFVLPLGIPSGQYQLDVVTPGNLHEVHPVIIQSGL